MKKLYTLMLIAGATAITGTAQSKFDAAGMMVMDTYAARLQNPTANLGTLDLPGGKAALSGRADARATIFVSLHEGATADDVEIRGFDIMSDFGNIIIASGSMDDIQALAECDFVKAISFGQQRSAMLDKAREDLKADAVHLGTDLSKAYNGKGVIAGIFDTGLEANHANFRNEDNSTRIKKLWHFSGSSGSTARYTDWSERVSRFTTDSRYETHATHTLGCMAGSYNGTGAGKVVTKVEKKVIGPITTTTVTVKGDVPNPYYGIAPGTDIAAACGELIDPSIAKSAELVAEYAKQEGRPAVFNLSLGGNIGSHDNTSMLNQTLAKLGEDIIICIAAGNEADLGLSIDHTFNSDTEFKTLFGSDDSRITTATGYIDIWSDSSKPFTVSAIVYDRVSGKILYELPAGGGKEETVSLGTSSTSYNHSSDFDAAYSGTSTIRMTASKNSGTNSRYNVLIYSKLTYNTSTNRNRNLMAGFKITGTSGQRIMMTTSSRDAAFINSRANGFISGNGEFSINDMACGDNVIVFGAYTTKDTWGILGNNDRGTAQAYNMEGLSNGNVCNFSSFGTTVDGRNLPDICAPGAAIVSSISSYYASNFDNYRRQASAAQEFDGKTYYWAAEQGTSMSCPIGAGTIALWLEANPNLGVEDVRKILTETAVKDENVTSHLYPVQWGAGKLNAYEGLKMAIQMAAGVNDVSLEGQDKLIITPNGVNSWEVYVPYASSVNAEIYNLAGNRVASANADGNTLSVSADGLVKGIYVISVNGTEARRIVVR